MTRLLRSRWIPAAVVESGKGLVDGLAGGADQLCKFVLAELVVGVDSVVDGAAEPFGELQQLLGQSAGDVGDSRGRCGAPATGVTLDRLVAALEAAHTNVLDRIPDAMLVAEHLGQVGEDLIEHVVLTARAHGISWSEIGSQMGVSKQAAQQRLAKASHAELEALDPKQGFTRFSTDGRNLLMAAHEAALTRRELFVTPARLAVAAGIASAEASLPKPSKKQQQLVPYDEAAQNVLARAFEVAVAHGADMVEVSHLVTALRGDFPEE